MEVMSSRLTRTEPTAGFNGLWLLGAHPCIPIARETLSGFRVISLIEHVGFDISGKDAKTMMMQVGQLVRD